MKLPRATPAAVGFGLIWAFLIVFVVMLVLGMMSRRRAV